MVAARRFYFLPYRIYLGVLIALMSQPGFAADPVQEIEVNITTHLGDQQSFVEGDVVSFLLTLDSDAFVYLFYQDAENNIVLIYPNQQSGSHYYVKGFFMPLPPLDKNYRFQIEPPFGEETLFAYASDNARVRLHGRKLKNGLSLIEDSIGEIEASIRQQSTSGFGMARLNLISSSN